jgi:hypothetical protein
VISHNWGTVVAYEALRRLDTARPDLPDGSARNFFTAGSALAIPPVKRRPRVVGAWVNLNAHFDVVGGPLGGNPFTDARRVGLDAAFWTGRPWPV